MDPREVLAAMLGAVVGLLIAIALLGIFPVEPVVEEVLVEVPTPVLFLIGVPVPGAPLQLTENEELGAWSDPAGEFYCFPVAD